MPNIEHPRDSAPNEGNPMTNWPRDFLWGVSTSAHQYEGNNVASDYWHIEHLGLPVFVEPSGDALDSYHRWPTDVELAADLGFNAYRLSIEWARIEPARDRFSRAERGHYAAMIAACREHGLEPVVTLHHITHPAWFARDGSWTAPDAAARFAEYVEFVSPILSDVRYVTTINEPNILATLGDLGALLRAQDPAAEYAAIAARRPFGQDGVLGAATLPEPDDAIVTTLIEAHRAAREVLHARTGARVGWTVAMQAFEPQCGGEDAWAAHTRTWEDRFLEASREDDWLGVQSYTSQLVGPDGPLGAPPGARTTQLGWAFRPDAVGIALRRAAEVVLDVPLIVTENGVATDDDAERIDYIDGALDAVASVLADGVDVRGYFHWTFIDNFEWTQGYAITFGLVSVDRSTFERTPKPSARHLGSIGRR